MLFLLGHFRAAMDQALCDLESRPDDAETRMLIVGCAIELGDFECAERHMNLLDAGPIPEDVSRQLPFFRYTLTRGNGPDGQEPAVRHLDDLYLAMGCRPIRMSATGNHGVFDSLTCVAATAPRCRDGYRPLRDGPLVSVVMTAYNVEHLVRTAVMSILNQSYRNLELIVVDDCSTDATLEVLHLMAGEDERMQVMAKDRNDGTYVSKNVGMLRANGKYVAFHDSDDWSHPDRLGKSIAVLESKPEIVAVTTNWVRMTTEGNMVLQNKNQYSYRACISWCSGGRRCCNDRDSSTPFVPKATESSSAGSTSCSVSTGSSTTHGRCVSAAYARGRLPPTRSSVWSGEGAGPFERNTGKHTEGGTTRLATNMMDTCRFRSARDRSRHPERYRPMPGERRLHERRSWH